MIANVLYRMKVEGRTYLPAEGAAVLVANHVSFVDWLLISSISKRPVRFVMYHTFMKLPLVGVFFRDAKVIPIAPAKENQETLDRAFDRIAEELDAGEIVCIFPEGGLTPDGKLQSFRPGVERILERTPVPVIPIAIEGMWGSFFSRRDGQAFKKPFRRFWSRVKLTVGASIAPESLTVGALEANVAKLGGFDRGSE